MKVLVTGADGFIGKHLCPELEKSGFTVEKHTISDSDISRTLPDYSGVDRVVHLAGLTFVPASWETPAKFYETNVMGTLNVLEFCRKNKCPMTYVSAYVYGQPQYVPVDEKHPLVPHSPYNHSKILAEELCGYYAGNFNMQVVILRPFNIYGFGQSPGFLLPSIFQQLMDPASKILKLENTDTKRDYVYVADVARAITAAVKNGGNGIYNVASGVSTSAGELAKIAMEASGIKKEITVTGARRKNEVSDIVASVEAARRGLGWAPKTTLREGVEKTFQEYVKK